MAALTSFAENGCALVIGAEGGIGAALLAHAQEHGGFAQVLGGSRRSDPPLDITQEAQVAAAAAQLRERLVHAGHTLRAVIVATGFLHGRGWQPEKTWQQLDADHLAHSFAVNAIGPALVMKHFLPLLPREGKSVLACLSAKVGSIGDNQLGGWYGYRASKAALNQLVHTAAIELRRRQPEALCLALHPGTVDTGLSTPFAKSGLKVQTPAEAAAALWSTLDRLDATASGRFWTQHGEPLPW
ncbi:MAG: SDR family NAD(P)-dependent oxidoreductase [Pseudomonadota bacterium]